MSGNENDRQDRTALNEAVLQLGAAQSGHLHVEQDASRRIGVRQAIQQLLGRRIGFDVIARQFQPALDRRPIRSIVIYYVDKTRHLPLLAVKTIEISPLDDPQSLKGSSSSLSSSRLTLYPHAATSHLFEQQLFENLLQSQYPSDEPSVAVLESTLPFSATHSRMSFGTMTHQTIA